MHLGGQRSGPEAQEDLGGEGQRVLARRVVKCVHDSAHSSTGSATTGTSGKAARKAASALVLAAPMLPSIAMRMLCGLCGLCGLCLPKVACVTPKCLPYIRASWLHRKNMLSLCERAWFSRPLPLPSFPGFPPPPHSSSPILLQSDASTL